MFEGNIDLSINFLFNFMTFVKPFGIFNLGKIVANQYNFEHFVSIVLFQILIIIIYR